MDSIQFDQCDLAHELADRKTIIVTIISAGDDRINSSVLIVMPEEIRWCPSDIGIWS